MTTDELAGLIGQTFIERRDVKAVQHADGSYTPDRSKFTMSDLRAHLEGSHTFGHYLVGEDGHARFFAFDIDLDKTGRWTDDLGIPQTIEPRNIWLDPTHPARCDLTIQLRCMADGLAMRVRRILDIPVAVAYSGHKGLHVYGLAGRTQASELREAAGEVLASFGCFQPTRGDNFWKHTSDYAHLTIEVFPKQDHVTDLGNLLRLPMGVNRKTGNQAFFVNTERPYSQLEPDDPKLALTAGSFR